MNGRFDLAPIGRRISTSRCGVISAMNLDHFALLILHYIRAGDEVAIPQPDLAPWRQAVILLGRNLPEIVLLDVQHARSGRSEEHTSELQSLRHLVCRLLLEKKKRKR